jgi:hypothetical protein
VVIGTDYTVVVNLPTIRSRRALLSKAISFVDITLKLWNGHDEVGKTIGNSPKK